MFARLARGVGWFFAHTLAALIGTAILSTPISRMSRPASVAGILWKELFISVICACLIGFLMYRTQKSKVGIWVWILPTAWFALHILSLLMSAHSQSALTQNSGLWREIWGFDCIERLTQPRCRSFFLFTVPFIRSVAYSLGIMVGIRFVTPVASPVREITVL
jgi:hypothetical protein